MKRSLVWILLLSITGVVFGNFLRDRWRGQPVELTRVSKGRLVEAIYATGRVDTDRRATVRARRRGPLQQLLVGPGAPVAAGQLVAVQDNTEAQLELERARKDQEALRAAAAEAEDAARRSEELFHAGLLPEQEWVKQRERAAELRQRLASQTTSVAMAEEQLRWFSLYAPLTGTVSQLHRRQGDLLAEGDEVLTVVDLSSAYLRVAVDERDLGKVRLGQEVRILFDAFPQEPLVGRVWRIVPTVDRLTKSADVLVELPQPQPPLQLDMTATVNIITQVVEDTLLVPLSALQGVGQERRVFRMGAGGRLQAVPVQVGACGQDRCQVLAGLVDGEQVVSEASGLKPGMRVRVP